MKSFAQFLTESKKQYAFRIKLACDCDKEKMENIKTALDKYRVSAISEPKSTPVAEKHRGFEHLKNVSINIIDILTDYPCSPVQIREIVRDCLSIPESHIMVTSPGEEANALPVAAVNDKKALLDTEELSPADPKVQDMVGDKKVASLLADLAKVKHGGEQYKGVNDAIQAKTPYREKAAKTTNDLPAGNKSMIGHRKMPRMTVR
jgi:hypothetical protein